MAKTKSFFIGDLKGGQYTGYRMFFGDLAEPRGFSEDAAKKYSVTVLIPKTDKAGIKRIKDAVTAAVNATDWSEKAKKQVLKTCFDEDAYNDYAILKDGDAWNERAAEEGKEPYPQREGHYTVKCSRKDSFGAPAVFDADASPIPVIQIAGEIQRGYWINVNAQVYCYDFNGKKGAAMQFDAVQKVREDEIFGQTNPFESLDLDGDEDDVFGDDVPM